MNLANMMKQAQQMQKRLQDAQKDLQSITLQIPIENVQPDLIDSLSEMTQQCAGNTPLRVQIFDTIKQNVITFNASPIRMNQTFYRWLKELQADEILQYKVN